MAAGRDIARHTALIRKQQKARNLKALQEEEQRRTEQERLSGMNPSEIRKQATKARRIQRESRIGHHRVGPVQELMLGPGSYQDKMDRGEFAEDKAETEPDIARSGVTLPFPVERTEAEGGGESLGDPEDGGEEGGEGPDGEEGDVTYEAIAFASASARALAEALPRISPKVLEEFEPSNVKGFTTADIRDIDAMLKADEEAEKEGA